MQEALADGQCAWGESLVEKSPALALPHLQAARAIKRAMKWGDEVGR